MHRKFMLFSVIIALFMLNSCAQQSQDSEIVNISASDLKAKIDAGENVLVLDVRTPEEFDGPLGHIEGAVLIPVDQLAARVGELAESKDKEVVVVCRSGNRSMAGTRIMLENNFKAVNMAGGMIAWNELNK